MVFGLHHFVENNFQSLEGTIIVTHSFLRKTFRDGDGTGAKTGKGITAQEGID